MDRIPGKFERKPGSAVGSEIIGPYMARPPTIDHDEEHLRFTTTVGGQTAYLSYRRVDDTTVDYRSTFVPPPLRRQGIGEHLVRAALEHAAGKGLRVIPTCWFVRRVMEQDG